MSRAARCCGALSITVEGEPAFSALRHCDNCKRRTGSAFGWSVYFAPGQVSAPVGSKAVSAFRAAFGHVERTFCSQRGSTVFWRAEPTAETIGVSGGCFADAAFAPPTISASDDKRCTWFEPQAEWARMF